jgi:hypothetical protein
VVSSGGVLPPERGLVAGVRWPVFVSLLHGTSLLHS